MTDFVRDLAAFASMSLFIASISVIALGMWSLPGSTPSCKARPG